MLIKHSALLPHLQKHLKPMYVLLGAESYLFNEAALSIKKACRQRGETDHIIVDIHQSSDWKKLSEEANSYSLFTEWVLVDIRFDKKTIDATGKEALTAYLKNINPRCLVLLQAAHVPAKQLSFLTQQDQVVLVQINPLTEQEFKRWIITELSRHTKNVASEIPALIYQYTEGNLLACAQIIEKVPLLCDEKGMISLEDIQALLTNQCEFQLYELSDACLSAQPEKAIQVIRQAYHQRVEPTLILWILTQEIRQLIQLSHLCQQNTPFTDACNQLKIWPKKARFYEKSIARLPQSKLYQLLHDCKALDDQIKSNQNHAIWTSFERLSLAFCHNISKP